MVLIRCWFLCAISYLCLVQMLCGGTSVGHKESHTLASRTTTYDNSVRPQRFSPGQSRCKNIAHGNEEIGLGLVEINPHDLADSVRGIDQRPYVLVSFAKLDYPFPGHQ